MSSGVRSPPHDTHDKIIDGKIKQILTSLNDITAINTTMKTF